ncbi:programmed cell death protein 6-like [Amphiura filiformis]|uniref:programmed cell death protein 6-like n=1 Tax=Amphiura filiformis TaxID=82378 RepID=UPI003B21EB40
MAYPGYGGQAPYGAPPGQQPYGAPPPAQQPYGAPPGQQPYGAPPAQQPYGAPPPGQYGAPPPGQYGAPPPAGYPGAQPGGPPPGMDPTVYSWFQSVDQDKSGQITALELQQALTNANWSHFNPETCRLMIGLFDKDNSGTIDLREFGALWAYITQWRGVFERYDKNRSGNIDSGELYQALNEMGFRVSAPFSNMIISRYDIQARQSLKLDDFIQICVLMRSLTDAFRQRDTQMSGTIQISYEDFMCMALLNKP